ncbi:hypothetical protein [Lewinella sp. W8]|uniref:hypothetical protein n=1 Tax=Lewinella sp. W8 TaxID=2528208 RepID=UPI00106852E9|nr:hypothetical protein [Lewinella sp. W8]MTB51123.1 hypothetical protein [Lewinella sp. W8]
MTPKFSLPVLLSLLMILASCTKPEIAEAQASPKIANPLKAFKKDPHEFGGWYCPDNFGFVPVDINRLDEVPVVVGHLPTEEELRNHQALIKVNPKKHPDAKHLDMGLPRVGRVFSPNKGIHELVIVIQAIATEGDVVVGYRFPNGGNGSAWLGEVELLSEDEVAALGPQPFFYKKATVKATKEDIWRAITQTDYARQLGEKFDQQAFFAADWTSDKQVRLNTETDGERAVGFVGLNFGNVYLHIDYIQNGVHYSEKLLMLENHGDKTTDLHFASGPFPDNFPTQQKKWENWFTEVVEKSQRTSLPD